MASVAVYCCRKSFAPPESSGAPGTSSASPSQSQTVCYVLYLWVDSFLISQTTSHEIKTDFYGGMYSSQNYNDFRTIERVYIKTCYEWIILFHHILSFQRIKLKVWEIDAKSFIRSVVSNIKPFCRAQRKTHLGIFHFACFSTLSPN